MRDVVALIGARFAWMIAILLVLSFVLFGVLAQLPGDPVDLLVTSNPNVRPEDVARLKRLRGLDKPWPVRWARWLVGHREALSPPPLSRAPPIIIDAPLEGSAQVKVRDDVLFDVAFPGVYEVPLVSGAPAADGTPLESITLYEILAAPSLGDAPVPRDPDDERDGAMQLDNNDRQLGGSTEHPAGVGRPSDSERAEAARKIGRLVSLASPRIVYADDDGVARVGAPELLVNVGASGSPRAASYAFDVVTGPGAFVEVAGDTSARAWTHRFNGPGQTAVIVRVTAPDGRSALTAFAVDHGVVPDPEHFHRGALFALVGDTNALGYSSTYKRPVWQLLFGLPHQLGPVQNTALLMLPALLLSLLIAVPLGVAAAARKGSLVDAITQTLSVLGVSVPAFWLGIMAMHVFAVALQWLPAGGIQTPGLISTTDIVLDRAAHAILPVCVLAVAWTGQWLRYVRSGVLEVMPADFVRTARAKGLAARAVMARHALRNALIPLVTVLALAAPQLFAGALLTETVFAWPGVGRLQYEAILHNDSYVAIVVFLVSAALVLLANLAADLLYLVVDPRLRSKLRAGRAGRAT